MTLDEAIAISDEIGKGDTERAANNRWLAEKLRILKWVEDCHIIDEARRAREEMHGWQADWRKVSDENAKLREAVATAIKVQAVLCGDADSWYCRNKCPLHRPESNDCLACDVIGVAQELGIEV